MADTFPRQQARTQRFTLGIPRSFRISPDGSRIAFLRSKSGTDPVSCLWLYDVKAGQEYLIADPAQISPGEEQLDPAEKARRERARERAGGIVGFATDEQLQIAAFVLSGQVYVADLTPGSAGTPGQPGPPGPARPSARWRHRPRRPTHGPIRLAGASPTCTRGRSGSRTWPPVKTTRSPNRGERRTYRSELRNLSRPRRWAACAATGGRLMVPRCWSPGSMKSQVQRWYIADPAHPDRPAAQVRYPVCGTPNADVSLVLAAAAGGQAGARAADRGRLGPGRVSLPGHRRLGQRRAARLR